VVLGEPRYQDDDWAAKLDVVYAMKPDLVSFTFGLARSRGQFGTAFLLADEAGTSPVHRAALTDGHFTQTAVTRAFTGRYARALRNRFIDDHDAQAVTGFPNVAFAAGPVLAAAARSGDPQGTSLWAAPPSDRRVLRLRPRS